MNEYKNTDWAWLAGFWDGEGSVGFTKEKNTFRLNCQLSHTEYDSVLRILNMLKDVNILSRGYTYQERDPLKHRDAHYIRITGTAGIAKFANLLLPYAITKKRHMEIAIEWAASRIAFAGGLDSKGNLKRGGKQKNKGYSEKEFLLINELKELNRRGPLDRIKRKEGRLK